MTLFSLLFLIVRLDLFRDEPTVPFQSRWEISDTPEAAALANRLLDRPFHYLGEGGQSLVFVSADDQVVLKLFKLKRFHPHLLVEKLPDTFPFKKFKEQHISKREQKLIKAFTGYQLAYTHCPHECGLIYVQLNPSNKPNWVTLYDKSNHPKEINLEKLPYVIQEKGRILSEELSDLLDQGRLAVAKQRIAQVLDLYLNEYRQGFYDLDHGVMHNIGCKENRVFHLDVGKLAADERMKNPLFYHKDLIKVGIKIHCWARKHYPNDSQEIAAFLEDSFSQRIGQSFKMAAEL